MCQGVERGAMPELATFGQARHGRGPNGPISREEEDLLSELDRLRAEYQELEGAAAEQDAGDSVALHDAQLERLRLAGLVQCYQEKEPSLEELAERYEGELEELAVEVLRLREEHFLLASSGTPAGAEEEAVTAPEALAATAVFGGPPPRARTAAEELHDEVRRLRRRHAEFRQRERRSWVEEWRLSACREEARRVMRQLKLQDRRLEESRERHAEAEAHLQEAHDQLVQKEREVEQEQAVIRRLHREAVGLREACYLPARLKRESGFLVRLLDQGCGRGKARRHQRSLEASRRLYEEVAAHAPSVLPLAGRTKADLEAEFSRLQRLEEAHNRALQRLHLAVTRHLMCDKDRDTLSLS